MLVVADNASTETHNSQYMCDQLMKEVSKIDLSRIKRRVARELEWSPAQVDQVEIRYRRFLVLSVIMGGEAVPVQDIDSMWHIHILADTRSYERDCRQAFGLMIHHRVNLDVDPSDPETLDHQVRLARTKEIYEQLFGQEYDQLSAPATCYSGGCQ